MATVGPDTDEAPSSSMMGNGTDLLTSVLDSFSKATMLEQPEATKDVGVNTAPEKVSAMMEANVVDGKRGLKVLFLSSDTGGGHRASAESLAKQFELLYPGTVYVLHDMVQNEGTPPYSSLVKTYKHLSAHPSQWKLVYGFSNSRAFEMIADVHLKLMCERAVRKRIMSYDPDVVVSVHPLMTNVPVLSCAKISQKTGKHLPMFTVVTDLGSAHCLWFANGVEKMFVGSEQIRDLAKARGKVPDEKLVMAGLPIRHEFAIQSENLGDRLSEQGQEYQKKVRAELELPFVDRRTILVMGGGEGVGSLSNIVNRLFIEVANNGIDAVILVVCGRNEKLKKNLATRDWDEILRRHHLIKENRVLDTSTVCDAFPTFQTQGCIKEGGVTRRLRTILSTGSFQGLESPVSAPMPTYNTDHYGDESKQTSPTLSEECAEATLKDEAATPLEDEVSAESPEKVNGSTTPPPEAKPEVNLMEEKRLGRVSVVGLGFVTRMAEYMVAADILVSKAGPGTISEAAALSLPVLLTSFLPGQEEGNVDYAIDGGFGAFCSDSDPCGVAEVVVSWLTDDKKMELLSDAAKKKGAPYAARDIAKAIGESTLKWREINEHNEIAQHISPSR